MACFMHINYTRTKVENQRIVIHILAKKFAQPKRVCDGRIQSQVFACLFLRRAGLEPAMPNGPEIYSLLE